MANICTTEVTITSIPEVIDWFEHEIKKISEINSDENRNLDFINKFGIEGENLIDKIGSKWLTVDLTMVERKSDESFFIRLETANYPPNVLIVNICKILRQKEKEISEDDYDETDVSGRYWDEAFQPIGVFSVYGETFETDEEYIEINYDDEMYWDNQVEPAFDNLEV